MYGPPQLRTELREAIEYLMERTALEVLSGAGAVRPGDIDWLVVAKDRVSDLLNMIPATLRVVEQGSHAHDG